MAKTGGIHGPGQGQSTIDLLAAHAAKVGIDVRTGHAVDDVYANADGAVVGVARQDRERQPGVDPSPQGRDLHQWRVLQ